MFRMSSRLKSIKSKGEFNAITIVLCLVLAKFFAVLVICAVFGGPFQFENAVSRTQWFVKAFPTKYKLLYALTNWDSGWYLGIAKFGYADFNYPFSFVLSPLYPIFIHLLYLVIRDIVISAVAISLVSGIIWAILFEKTAEYYMSNNEAINITLLSTFFPVTFFVTTIAYSEPLFLLFSTGAWLLHLKQKHMGSSLLCAACAITRNYGILYAALIFLDLARSRKFKKAFAFSILPVVTYFAYMLYGYWISGDLLIAIHSTIMKDGPHSVGWFLFQMAQGKVIEIFPFVMAFLWYGSLVLILCLKLFQTDGRLGSFAILMLLFFVFFTPSSSLPRYIFGSIFPLWLGVRINSRKFTYITVVIFFTFSLLLFYQFNSNLPPWYP